MNASIDPLLHYTLHFADNALILGQRNAAWTGHGPILEQDIAISNIALDLVGQARNFYQYAARQINQLNETAPSAKPVFADAGLPATEDTLAYLRNPEDFKNCLLVELPRGDWAVTVLRQFFFSTCQFYLYQQLRASKDRTMAAIAEKSLKEVTYHLRWSAEWVIRLGDGTPESNRRINRALQELWPYTAELTTNAIYETMLLENGIAVDAGSLSAPWLAKVKEVFAAATLQVPQDVLVQTGGKEGRHTENLGHILDEMQFLQRTYPGAEW